MSFFSKWVDTIREIFIPRDTKTVEAVAVEVSEIAARTQLAAVNAEKVVKKEAPKAKAAKKPAAKKPAAKKPAAKKKPNIKIVK